MEIIHSCAQLSGVPPVDIGNAPIHCLALAWENTQVLPGETVCGPLYIFQTKKNPCPEDF